jgi:hypothetical protein
MDATGTATAQDSPKLYDFSTSEHVIELNTRPSGAPRIVRHKLRKPTFIELEARDRKQAAETITKGNEEFIESASSAPDLELWAKICTEAQGYLPNGEWLKGDDLAKVPADHKLAAIRALYQAEYEVVNDDSLDYFALDGVEVKVKQTLHGFEIVHTLREMTEAERLEFEGKSYRASFVRGKGKETRTRIQGNLKAFVDLYNKLIQGVSGAIGEADPIHKRGVINAMLAAQTAVLSD